MNEVREIIEINPVTDKEDFDMYYNMWLTGESIITNRIVQSQYMKYINFNDEANKTLIVNLEDFESNLINLTNEFISFLGSNTQMNAEIKDFLDTKLYNFIINSRDILSEFIEAKNEFDEGLKDTNLVDKIKYLYLLLPFNLIVMNRNKIFDGNNLFDVLTNLIEHLTDIEDANGDHLFETSNDRFNINELYEEKIKDYYKFLDTVKHIVYDESRYNNIDR